MGWARLKADVIKTTFPAPELLCLRGRCTADGTTIAAADRKNRLCPQTAQKVNKCHSNAFRLPTTVSVPPHAPAVLQL
jgi:hypothetical protein